MTTEDFLLEQLRQPGYLGGDKLGEKLGISRVAVSKHMAALRKKGLPLVSAPGKGYRLEEGVELLQRENILEYIDPQHKARITEIHIHQQLASTNQWALDQEFFLDKAIVCLAESQLSGRGRRDRQWHSTAYRNLMYSLSWRFVSWPPSLPAISLLAGLVVAEALELCGVADVQIKWPNDIYLKGKKLGGLLVSAKGEASGACDVVIGIGINHHILEKDGKNIDQDWIDLNSLGLEVSRNRLTALITEGLIDLLPKFEQKGFAPFKDAWNSRGLYIDQRVRLFDSTHPDAEELRGICRGVDDLGVLQIETGSDSIIEIRDAEMSMRPE